MASKTQKTELIRARKHAPNRVNLKTAQKRLAKNFEVLARVIESK
jgi:hypothetical protein